MKKKIVKSKVIQIKATAIKMVPIEKIIPHPKNPNIHSEEQIEELKKQIKTKGFRNPLIVSSKSGYLNQGHGRLEAAIQLGMATLPVIYQDFDNDSQEYASMVADNQVAKGSKLNIALIKIDMQAFKLDPISLGFGKESNLIDVKGHTRDAGSKNKEIDTDEYGGDLEHKCPKCGFEFSGKKK